MFYLLFSQVLITFRQVKTAEIKTKSLHCYFDNSISCLSKHCFNITSKLQVTKEVAWFLQEI